MASRDIVYLSMKQVTPRRRARPAKETLLAIEPALSDQNQRFSLHVDRRTKRGVKINLSISLTPLFETVHNKLRGQPVFSFSQDIFSAFLRFAFIRDMLFSFCFSSEST